MYNISKKLLGIISLLIILTACSASHKLKPSEVEDIVNKTADWQLKHFSYAENGSPGYLHDYGIDAWTNAVLYIGLQQWAETTSNEDYFNWLYLIGEQNNWTVAANFLNIERFGIYHADELCIGQFYLEMFNSFRDDRIKKSTYERIETILNKPPAEEMLAKNKQRWTWCDALFMAPPVYIQAAVLGNEPAYLEFMHQEFMATYLHLYDKEHGLFFRDDSFFDKRENNGKKIFWGRGNGWVVAGIARMLTYLPTDSEYRTFYEKLLQTMVDSLLPLRNENGFWHASLLDPESYPSPETSATALITYAMAYGVNAGILSKKKYKPLIIQSWNALASVIDEDGKLGFVQPIGADPRMVTQDMSAVYGVGAFLLAGSQIYKLASN
jgi:unsaturated rhamnogalacturonyl hydrolase